VPVSHKPSLTIAPCGWRWVPTWGSILMLLCWDGGIMKSDSSASAGAFLVGVLSSVRVTPWLHGRMAFQLHGQVWFM
jgi:hypothetical protein